MRIRQLELSSIHPFDTFQLDFGTSGHALHILYGPNEAGKSTLRQLLIDLLFGGKIEEGFRARYESRSRMEGILESPTRSPFHIRRKKRNTKLLLTDEAGTELSEDLLVPYLSGYNKERFSLLFGFDHVRLRQGGESLLQSGGHAGVSLFEAGGGIQYLQGIRTGLADRATNLLDPRFTKSSTKLLNKALRAYTEAQSGIRTNSLRGEDWQQLSEEISMLDKKQKLLGTKKVEKAKELSKLERIVRVYRHVERYQELESKVISIDGIRVLTSPLEEQMKKVLSDYETTCKELSKQEEICLLHKQELEGISLDKRVLQFEEEIKRLGERLSQYMALKDNEIPLATQRMLGRHDEVKRILNEIAPNTQMADASKLRISFAVEEEVLRLSEDLKKARIEVIRADDRYQELQNDVLDIQNELMQIGSITDVSKLRQVVKEIREVGDLEEMIQKRELQIKQKTESLQMILLSQQLWDGELYDFVKIPVPLRETMDDYQENFTRILKEIEDNKRDLAKVKAEQNSILQQIEVLELLGQVPVETDLEEARNHRDSGWQLIKQAWLNHEEDADLIRTFCGGNLELSEAFEAAMARVDEIADWMRKESDRSAQRAHLLLSQKQLERTTQDLENQLKECENEFMLLSENWRREWGDCKLIPRSPVEMKGWIVNFYRPIVDGIEIIHSLQVECTEWIQKKDRYVALATQILKELEALPDNNVFNLRHLVDICEQKVAGADEKLQLQLAQQERLKVANRKQHDFEETMKNVQSLLTEFESAWKDVRNLYVFLPESPDIAIRYIQKLHEMFQKIDDAHNLKHEIATKEAFCHSFDRDVTKLVQDLGEVNPSVLSSLVFVRSVQNRLANAKNELARKNEQQKIVQKIEEEILHIRMMVNHFFAEIKAFQDEYHCKDVDALRGLIENSLAYKQILLQKKQVESNLREAGDGFEVVKLVAEVEEIDDFDELPPRMDALKNELEDLEHETEDVHRQLWERKQAFDKLDGSRAEAIAFAQKAEQSLAEIDPLWNEYIRVELARRLLGRSIDEFRRKNESTVLSLSSDYFAKLTLGHYTSLSIEYENNEPFIESITDTGEKRRVSEMSDGTRDQLFLALRLAFLRQHLDSSEPLPLIMDDILVHFDDRRTEVTLEILHQLASRTQIVYFTHHQSVVEAVNRLRDSSRIQVHHLVHQLV